MALAGAAARREFSVARARTPFALPGCILASTSLPPPICRPLLCSHKFRMTGFPFDPQSLITRRSRRKGSKAHVSL